MTWALLAWAMGAAATGTALPGAETPPAVSPPAGSVEVASPRPRAVIILCADGLRAEWLDPESPLLSGPSFSERGLRTVLRGGLRFLNARVESAICASAPGHATLATGSDPSGHGIPANAWFGESPPREILSTETPGQAMVLPGATMPPAGPRDSTGPSALTSSTLADEILLSTGFRGKALAFGELPAGAVFPAGRLGKAFWLSDRGTTVTSSTYYFPARGEFPPRLPRWVEDLARGFAAGTSTPRDKVVELALAAIQEESLGRDAFPDLLWISVDVGPSSPLVPGGDALLDGLLGLDRAVMRILSALGEPADPGGPAGEGSPRGSTAILVITASHGAPHDPALLGKEFPSGTLDLTALGLEVKAHLDRTVRPLDWVLGTTSGGIWLNPKALQAARKTEAEVEELAAAALAGKEGVAAVFARSRVAQGDVPRSDLGLRVGRSYVPGRFPSLLVIPKPYFRWKIEGGGSAGTSPYAYDSHVPLVLHGAGIRPGRVARRVSIADVAPTLAVLAGAGLPSAATGELLREAFE